MTPVFVLLRICDPFAIGGFVTSIIVDAIERQARWAITHVGKEVFKCEPTLANTNSSSAVIKKIRVLRIAASLKHRFPAVISRCAGLSMLGKRATLASAANRIFASEADASNDALVSAVANDKPASRFPFYMGESDDRQSSKALSCNIFDRHAVLRERVACLGAASVSALSRPAFIAQMVLR
jgi:hypothetical protein